MTKILLIVSGGIAAYKALEVARLLRAQNVQVIPVMTEAAKAFVTPLSLESLCNAPVRDSLFALTQESEIGHIALARSADLVLVCPATAQLMARMAHGMADDLATTLLLATTSPILLAPAMNVRMWEHPATQGNLALLRERGVDVIGPEAGPMACGETGPGRLSEPEAIAAAVLARLAPRSDLAGRRILVTAGPTREALDAVRFLSNHSSGKQGYAIAESLARRGAEVVLISGPVALPAPGNLRLVPVRTGCEMRDAVENALPADAVICVAAVSDWRAADVVPGKIKKEDAGPPRFDLTENPDILAGLCRHVSRPALVIGFAAETDRILENAVEKRRRKGCDWLIVNDVGDGVFGSSRNQVSLIDDKGVDAWPEMDKSAVAERLAERIAAFFDAKTPSL